MCSKICISDELVIYSYLMVGFLAVSLNLSSRLYLITLTFALQPNFLPKKLQRMEISSGCFNRDPKHSSNCTEMLELVAFCHWFQEAGECLAKGFSRHNAPLTPFAWKSEAFTR